MKCKKCKKDVTHLINGMCIPCYVNNNLPSGVKDKYWVHAESYERSKRARGKVNRDFDENLASAITEENVVIEKNKNIISIQTENEVISIPITTENIDNLAQKSGILEGKWLIHRLEPEIDSVWKVIAENTWNGRLSTSAKVSTPLHKSKKYVICIYTHDYLDLVDVKSVREKLRTLGFNEELCYKPDIYTYLGIYYQTTSLSPCRYRM